MTRSPGKLIKVSLLRDNIISFTKELGGLYEPTNLSWTKSTRDAGKTFKILERPVYVASSCLGDFSMITLHRPSVVTCDDFCYRYYEVRIKGHLFGGAVPTPGGVYLL